MRERRLGCPMSALSGRLGLFRYWRRLLILSCGGSPGRAVKGWLASSGSRFARGLGVMSEASSSKGESGRGTEPGTGGGDGCFL